MKRYPRIYSGLMNNLGYLTVEMIISLEILKSKQCKEIKNFLLFQKFKKHCIQNKRGNLKKPLE